MYKTTNIILNKQDELFKELYNHKKCTLKFVLHYLNLINESRIEFGMKPFDIEKEYKDYLIKYWGNYKVD